MSKYKYDLIVIGAGSGGISSAILAKNLGKRVALVEKRRIGGECTWSGCVPSKALIRAAETAHEIQHLRQVGLTTNEIQLNTDGVMNHVRAIIQRVYKEETPDVFKKMGIDVFIGEARFIDSHQIQLGDQRLSSKTFIIATGSSPAVPHIPGLETIDYLTNETLFEIEKLPKSMIVLGGGPIGMEMAQAFHRLGTKITVVQRSTILKKDDQELVELLIESLKSEGLEILAGTTPLQFAKKGDMVQLQAIQDDKPIEVEAEKVLVATGRQPNVSGLALEKAGVQYSKQGIVVDD